MTIQEKNYSAEHTGPFETLLQRDFMGFHGKYFIGENLGLTGYLVKGLILKAAVSGEQIDASRHRLLVDVKAVTLHRFQLQFADGLWKADVVLDV